MTLPVCRPALTGILSHLREALAAYRDKILFAYLFGSTARGEAVASSDLDVAVYFQDSQAGSGSHHDAKVDLYMHLSRALQNNGVDIVVLNFASNLMLLDEIVRQGIVLLALNPAIREDFELRVLHRAMDFRAQRRAAMGV